MMRTELTIDKSMVNGFFVTSNEETGFSVATITATPIPNTAIYAHLHQDYSSEPVYLGADKWPQESRCGEIAVERLLQGGRGHFGPLEAPQITLNCAGFVHDTVMQLRTHRVGVSFDVMSQRYCSQGIIDVSNNKKRVDEVFYFRGMGQKYCDRKGCQYEYDEEYFETDTTMCINACHWYKEKIEAGFSEEHARHLLPQNVRQHFCLSLNLRSLAHILLIRGRKDTQMECQMWAELVLPHFELWCPEIYQWFAENLYQKGRLAP